MIPTHLRVAAPIRSGRLLGDGQRVEDATTARALQSDLERRQTAACERSIRECECANRRLGCANGPQWNPPVDAVTDQLFRGHSLSDALGDTVADGLVDISPILERARQYGLAHSLLEVTDDVGDQPVALGVVHDLAH